MARRDYVSEILGDPRRIESYAPPGFHTAIVGPYLRGISVSLSRYYLFLDPPLVVDYEPAPSEGRFYCEEKRKWCHEQGIVYVPIFLRDKLTPEAFAERVTFETHALAEAKKDHRVEDALDAGRTVTWDDPAVQQLIDEEAVFRLNAEIREGLKVYGTSRDKRLSRIRREVEREFLIRMRDGRLGRQLSYRQRAVPAGG